MNSISSNPLSVIETARVTNIPTVPRRDKPVSELSLIGKDNLRWTELKADHRFCGIDYEAVSGAPVVNSRHDIITLELNIRTIRSQHISAKEGSQALIHYVICRLWDTVRRVQS